MLGLLGLLGLMGLMGLMGKWGFSAGGCRQGYSLSTGFKYIYGHIYGYLSQGQQVFVSC